MIALGSEFVFFEIEKLLAGYRFQGGLQLGFVFGMVLDGLKRFEGWHNCWIKIKVR
jgi:hypothetical protein